MMGRMMSALGAALPLLLGSGHARGSPYSALRDRYYDIITGGPSYSVSDPHLVEKIQAIDLAAADYESTLVTADNRAFLWADLDPGQAPDSGYIQVSFERLEAMALATSTRGASLHDDPTRRARVIAKTTRALDWLVAHWYSPTTERDGVWYTWRLGVPASLTQSMVLLRDSLTPEQNAAYLAALHAFVDPEYRDPVTSGFNEAAAARVYMVLGMLEEGPRGDDALRAAGAPFNDDPNVVNLLDVQTDPQANGFHSDGSYVFHGQYPYIGGYGLAALQEILQVNYTLLGSPWDVSANPNFRNLGPWCTGTFLPWIYKGSSFDVQRGRGLAQPAETASDVGHEMIPSLVVAASILDDAAPGGVDDEIRALAKHEITEAGLSAFAASPVTLWEMTRIGALLDDASVVATQQPDSYRQFTASDTAIAHRNYPSAPRDWAFALKMMSASRMANYETLSSHKANLQGWNQGNGWTQLLVGSDVAQYDDGYWVTANIERMEGTTASAHSRLAPGVFNDNDFAGGATDGFFGVSGFALAPNAASLRALKSYFVFDEEIVALGSNISNGSSSAVVETTLLNRKLKPAGNNALTINGWAQSTAESSTSGVVRSLWLQGNTPDSDIGVYFPTRSRIETLRSKMSGCWAVINSQEADCPPAEEPVNHHLEIWQDHGAAPKKAKYAYVLIPGVSSATTLAYARTPDVAVLRQDEFVHAVKDGPALTTMANFWTDSPRSFSVGARHRDMFTCDHRASLIEHQSGTVTSYSDLYVADPTQANTGSINCEIRYVATSIILADPGVTVTQRSPSLKFSVDVRGAQGKTFRLKTAFRY